jgi:uncharacterized protein YcbX
MPLVGFVAELWRFPVKSMKGEQLQGGDGNGTRGLG